MPSVGSVDCTFLRGFVPPMAQLSEQWHVPGIDGDGVAILGKTCEPFRLEAVLYSSGTGVTALLAELVALTGQVVNVTTDFGQSVSVYLKQCGQPRLSAASIPGTSITARASIDLTCLPLS